MTRIATLFLIAASACSTGAWGQKHAKPEQAPCPAATDMQQRHLLGHWQAELGGQAVALRLGPHPELRESVRGTLQRGGQTVQVVGDVDDGQLTLEESEDGKRISATWLGEVAEGRCGKEIRGTWSPEAAPGASGPAPAPVPFVLRKQSGW